MPSAAISNGDQRTQALFGLWAEVNRIADESEDSNAIRALIAEAGIQPNIHVGVPAADFTPTMVAEWVLGQWASAIDVDSPFLNTMRNVSLAQYEKLEGA